MQQPARASKRGAASDAGARRAEPCHRGTKSTRACTTKNNTHKYKNKHHHKKIAIASTCPTRGDHPLVEAPSSSPLYADIHTHKK